MARIFSPCLSLTTCRLYSTKFVSTVHPTSIKIASTSYPTDEWTNVTPKIVSLTERKLHLREQHPLGLLSRGIRDHFSSFKSFTFNSPVVSLEENFDSLLIPPDHVSRSKSDTYYVNKQLLLRSHTSAHQKACLDAGARKFICIADVYRRDVIDSTHFPAFHQCELMQLYSAGELDVTGQLVNSSLVNRTEHHQEYHDPAIADKVMTRLKETIQSYITKLLGPSIEMKWVPAFFPFTHPSVELEILVNGKWTEVLGAGIVEHKLLMNSNINDSIGWALGFGLERLAMLKYGVKDIRIFWSNDTGVTHQFKHLSPWDAYTFKPISSFPQCINDISFWLPDSGEFSSNDFYDLVRSSGEDLVEQIELIDDFTNKKGRRSHCYRIVYRSNERTLTQSEVNIVHEKISREATRLLNVHVR